nr:hypothetical protein GCM10020092_096330 [Actinoplanes digitatis]
MRRTVETAAPRPDDEGLSLIEMLITMSVMSIVMIVFTTGIAQVYWANGRIENSAVAQSQLNVAFQRFDRELRYASWIGQPELVDSHLWYVEFAEADPTRCNRLRLDTTAQPSAERTERRRGPAAHPVDPGHLADGRSETGHQRVGDDRLESRRGHGSAVRHPERRCHAVRDRRRSARTSRLPSSGFGSG